VPANANALIEARSLGRRRTHSDDPGRELGALLGRVARVARLRRALPPPHYTRAECREIVEALRREI